MKAGDLIKYHKAYHGRDGKMTRILQKQKKQRRMALTERKVQRRLKLIRDVLYPKDEDYIYLNEPGRLRKYNLVCSCLACSDMPYKQKGFKKNKYREIKETLATSNIGIKNNSRYLPWEMPYGF